MKKNFYLLVSLLCFQLLANAQTWHPIGESDSDLTGLSTTHFSSTASKGVPYVAFMDEANNKILVQKNVNNAWETIGMVEAATKLTRITVGLDGAVYLLYTAGPSGSLSSISVKTFSNNTWEFLGSEAFLTVNSVEDVEFGVSANGTVFLSYIANRRLNVVEYKDSAWVALTDGLTTNTTVSKLNLAILDNAPIISFLDNKVLWLKKYDGTTWGNFAKEIDFGTTAPNQLDLCIDNGSVYLAYVNRANELFVDKYDAINDVWTNISGLIASRVYALDLQFENNIPHVAYAVYDSTISSYRYHAAKLENNLWEVKGNLINKSLLSFFFSISNDQYFMGFQDLLEPSLSILNKSSNSWEVLARESFNFDTGQLGGIAVINRTPYISFYDNAVGIIVQKYNGNYWESVGSPFATSTTIGFSKLYVYDNELYLLYTAPGSLKFLRLDKWNGTQWVKVGNNVSQQEASKGGELVFTPDGDIYAFYKDDSSQKRGGVSLMVFTKGTSNWQAYGGFSEPNYYPNVTYYQEKLYTITQRHVDVSNTWKGYQLTFSRHHVKNGSLSEHVVNSTEAASNYRMVSDENHLYFSYISSDYKLTVKKHSAANPYVTILSPNDGINAIVKTQDHQLLIDNGILYIAYRDFEDKKLYLQRYVNNAWEIVDNGNVSSHSVSNFAIASNNHGIIAGYNSLASSIFAKSYTLTTLPVFLKSFDVKDNKIGQVDIAWNTASETSNAYFTILKSNDGENYQVLNVEKSKGNKGQAYRIFDSKPFGGTTYYKLTQTDFDGTIKELGVRAINLGQLSMTTNLVVFPNPTRGGTLYIKKSSLAGLQQVSISNLVGKTLTVNSLEFIDGVGVLKIHDNIPNGIYLLNVDHSTTKIIVKR